MHDIGNRSIVDYTKSSRWDKDQSDMLITLLSDEKGIAQEQSCPLYNPL